MWMLCVLVLVCSRTHSLSLSSVCVVRKYQHRISASTLVINHILYDIDTHYNTIRWQHWPDAFIMMITTMMMMMVVLMMWPLSFLSHTYTQHTLHCFPFVGLFVLLNRATIDCRSQQILSYTDSNKEIKDLPLPYRAAAAAATVSQYHISIRMAHVNRLYTVINFNLMKSSYFIPSKMEIWFSSPMSSLTCSLLPLIVAMFQSHFIPLPFPYLNDSFIYEVNRTFIYIAFLHNQQAILNLFILYTETNTEQALAHTYRLCETIWHCQNYTDKMLNNKKKLHTDLNKDQMLVLKLCR